MAQPRGATVVHEILALIQGAGGVAIHIDQIASTLGHDALKVRKALQNYARAHQDDEGGLPFEQVDTHHWRWLIPGVTTPAGEEVDLTGVKMPKPRGPRKPLNARARGVALLAALTALYEDAEDIIDQYEAEATELRAKAAAYDRITRITDATPKE